MQPTVYIMASEKRGTLYVGVTSNLTQRAWQHKQGLAEGFLIDIELRVSFTLNNMNPWSQQF